MKFLLRKSEAAALVKYFAALSVKFFPLGKVMVCRFTASKKEREKLDEKGSPCAQGELPELKTRPEGIECLFLSVVYPLSVS